MSVAALKEHAIRDTAVSFSHRCVCVGMVLLAIAVAGCANLQTVNRKSHFKDGGRAIHLDAQQRVILTAGSRFCAEPSPDALASYASSLGLGIAGPNKYSGSVAQAMQSNAGSIGLRTQSITLMRDALYRLCEAGLNKQISDVSAATFLTRSQDLTAVVLAIEQLTGAVAAPPIVLSGSASANASALLLSNQQMLDQAKKDEVSARETAEKARKANEEALVARNAKALELDNAKEAAAQAEESGTDEEKAAATAKVEALAKEHQALKDEAAAKETSLTTAQQSLAQATKNREAIEAQRDSSYTSVAASTTGSGVIGVFQREPMEAGAVKDVAGAVKAMVERVLTKTYSTETCMAFLTMNYTLPANDTVRQRTEGEIVELSKTCLALVKAEIENETTRNQIQTQNLRALLPQ